MSDADQFINEAEEWFLRKHGNFQSAMFIGPILVLEIIGVFVFRNAPTIRNRGVWNCALAAIGCLTTYTSILISGLTNAPCGVSLFFVFGSCTFISVLLVQRTQRLYNIIVLRSQGKSEEDLEEENLLSTNTFVAIAVPVVILVPLCVYIHFHMENKLALPFYHRSCQRLLRTMWNQYMPFLGFVASAIFMRSKVQLSRFLNSGDAQINSELYEMTALCVVCGVLLSVWNYLADRYEEHVLVEWNLVVMGVFNTWGCWMVGGRLAFRNFWDFWFQSDRLSHAEVVDMRFVNSTKNLRKLFDSCIEDPVRLASLKQFMIKEQSENYLLFFCQVASLRNSFLVSARQRDAEMVTIGRNIYSEFLTSKSHHAVCLSSSCQESLDTHFSQENSQLGPRRTIEMLGRAQEEVANERILKDIFPRFLESERKNT
jgi:hypothetical protein